MYYLLKRNPISKLGNKTQYFWKFREGDILWTDNHEAARRFDTKEQADEFASENGMSETHRSSVINKSNDLKKEVELATKINKSLSPKNRIEGLINQSDVRNLVDVVRQITADLRREGIDRQDIEEYLKEEVSMVVNHNAPNEDEL